MATTHFPTQAVLKEYSNSATLNITEANREADVYWIVLKSDSDNRVYVNLYKPCLIEIYYCDANVDSVYLMKLNEVKYANSFSIDSYKDPETNLMTATWAKVYL